MPSDSHANTVNLRPICRSTQNAARGAIFLRIMDCEIRIIEVRIIKVRLYHPIQGEVEILLI